MIQQMNEENSLVFVELYQKYPCLYAVNTLEYHFKDVKGKAYDQLCREFNETTAESYSIADVESKIANIRTSYSRNLNKVKKSQISDSFFGK